MNIAINTNTKHSEYGSSSTIGIVLANEEVLSGSVEKYQQSTKHSGGASVDHYVPNPSNLKLSLSNESKERIGFILRQMEYINQLPVDLDKKTTEHATTFINIYIAVLQIFADFMKNSTNFEKECAKVKVDILNNISKLNKDLADKINKKITELETKQAEEVKNSGTRAMWIGGFELLAGIALCALGLPFIGGLLIADGVTRFAGGCYVYNTGNQDGWGSFSGGMLGGISKNVEAQLTKWLGEEMAKKVMGAIAVIVTIAVLCITIVTCGMGVAAFLAISACIGAVANTYCEFAYTKEEKEHLSLWVKSINSGGLVGLLSYGLVEGIDAFLTGDNKLDEQHKLQYIAICTMAIYLVSASVVAFRGTHSIVTTTDESQTIKIIENIQNLMASKVFVSGSKASMASNVFGFVDKPFEIHAKLIFTNLNSIISQLKVSQESQEMVSDKLQADKNPESLAHKLMNDLNYILSVFSNALSSPVVQANSGQAA